MKIVIINGQNHMGSTYHIAHELAEKVGGTIEEYFLPRDFKDFCVGCTTCFKVDYHKCPHYEKINPITQAMLEADLIILASPTYVYHVTGAMKNFLDHYGYMWMVHRPEKAMFTKQAVCVSTAAGGGQNSANKDMEDSLFFWGVGKTYKLGFAIRATKWDAVKEPAREKIDKATDKLAKQIRNAGRVKPGLKTRAFFMVMRLLNKHPKKGWSEVDRTYWEDMGWTMDKRPWK